MDHDAIVTFKVNGYTYINENLTFLRISLKEIDKREIQSRECHVVSVSSYIIAPHDHERYISMVFPSQMLKEDLLGCQTYIRDKLITAELGYNSPPTFRTNIAPLTSRLVEIADRLNMDYDRVRCNDDMPGWYYFRIYMDIIIHLDIDTVDVINIEDEEEDGLFDEQVTSRTRTSNTAIKKLKVSGRFVIADHKKKELASCCICLEEMFDGKKLLVGLPKCKHVHHESCILHWLDYTNSCPLCR